MTTSDQQGAESLRHQALADRKLHHVHCQGLMLSPQSVGDFIGEPTPAANPLLPLSILHKAVSQAVLHAMAAWALRSSHARPFC